jgi:uncharacterized protein
MTATIAFSTPPSASAWQRWLVYSPAARIVIYAAMVFGIGFLIHPIAPALGWTAKTATPLQHALAMLLIELASTVIAYLILVYLIERRSPRELSLRAIPTYGVAGLLGGAALFSIVVGLLWLFGSYHVSGTNPQVDWLPAVLVGGVTAGIAEEIVTRGALFRILEEGLGTWAALAISALFFGGMHISNPGATLWSSLAIAIEAGILLALVYHVTRSLWACIGLHAAWNTMQGPVYGIPVSGFDKPGWLVSSRTGPDWLSGGAFGAEASVVALATCSVVSLVLLVIAIRRNNIVPPSWSRKRAAAATGDRAQPA